MFLKWTLWGMVHLKSAALSQFFSIVGRFKVLMKKPELAIRSKTEVVHLLNRKSEYSLTQENTKRFFN